MTAASSSAEDGPGVEDLLAVYDLSLRYADAADRRDGEAFAALFEPSGELHVPAFPDEGQPGVTRRGHEQLREVPSALKRYVRTFHVVSTPRLQIDGDDATGTVACVAHHVGESPDATDTIWYIRYRDRYARGPEGWRIRRRVLDLQWVEVRPVERVVSPEMLQ